MSSKIYSAVFYPLSLATIVSSVFPLCCSAIPRNATGHGRGEDWYLILLLSLYFNPSVLRTPPLYFAAQNTEEEGEMYSPFASASILYTTPRKAAGHGRGGVLKYPFDSGT